jgi:hypothetical protein
VRPDSRRVAARKSRGEGEVKAVPQVLLQCARLSTAVRRMEVVSFDCVMVKEEQGISLETS